MLTIVLAQKCEIPTLVNAALLSNNTYLYNSIEVVCNEGYIPKSRRKTYIICTYNQEMNFLEWENMDLIDCIPTSCNPHPDFRYFNESKPYYNIGEILNYSCPNGHRIRSRCMLDEITNFGVWNFNGSCNGISCRGTFYFCHFKYITRP